jgi:hypothetical protein
MRPCGHARPAGQPQQTEACASARVGLRDRAGTADDPEWLTQVIASHNESPDHPGMRETVSDALAARLRAMSIDNFSVSGSTVRIGRTRWAAVVCRCGDPACDGWSLEPLAVALPEGGRADH